MVAGVVLVVLIEDLVAGPHDDRCTELQGTATRLALPVARRQGSEASDQLARLHKRGCPERPRADDLRCQALLVEQYRERDLLVLDERLCIPLAAGSDGGDTCTRGEDLVVSLADLTGPLTAGQSTEVAQEQQHMGSFPPEVTEAVLGPVRIDQDLVGELSGVERHSLPRGYRDGTFPNDLA